VYGSPRHRAPRGVGGGFGMTCPWGIGFPNSRRLTSSQFGESRSSVGSRAIAVGCSGGPGRCGCLTPAVSPGEWPRGMTSNPPWCHIHLQANRLARGV
jgi:hypothetical protein